MKKNKLTRRQRKKLEREMERMSSEYPPCVGICGTCGGDISKPPPGPWSPDVYEWMATLISGGEPGPLPECFLLPEGDEDVEQGHSVH